MLILHTQTSIIQLKPILLMLKITRLLRLALFVLILLTGSIAGFSQSGTLDVTFGTNGTELFDLYGYHENGNDIKCLDDTTMLIIGSTSVSTSYVYDGYIMKLLSDGTQDMSWGTNGLVIVDYGEDTFFYDIELLSDGKFLISGAAYLTVSDAEFFVAKFNPDGTADATFGTNGVFFSSYSTEADVCETMAIQSDGKIVMAGRTYLGPFSQLLFLRVNSDGTLDTSFGTNGYTEISGSVQDERVNSLGILSSGAIVGVGYGYHSTPWFGDLAMVAKLNPDGTPMMGFGTNGVMTPAIFTDYSIARTIAIHNDSLFITGNMDNPVGEDDLFLVKLDSSAIADPSFGTGGMALFDLNQYNSGRDMFVNDDDKIYVSGTSGLAGMSDREFLLCRYLPDGSLDTSFNSVGYTLTDFRPDWDESNALDMQVDGKIVCTGMSNGLTSGNNDIPVARYLNDYLPSGLIADFDASSTLICEDDLVDFTDLSYSTDSTVQTWQWNFEGGAPATSSSQNPTVQYASDGSYDVQLIVYDGIYYDTLLREDCITVEAIPDQTDMPAGPTDVCNTYNFEYTTNPVQYADSYNWEVTPTDAGSMVGTDTNAVFESSSSWFGTCYIKVRASGLCGYGAWSADLEVELRDNPEIFVLTGDGGYCTGSSGAELILDGSETGVDYELFLDEVSTGIIMPGTGDSIDFGFFTDEGLYTATGFNDYCNEAMVGQIYVHEVFPPAQPSIPVGPEEVCNTDTTVYATTPVLDADNYVWTLNPADAGELTANLDSVEIVWSASFEGIALLSVQSENDCGLSSTSDNLSIDVLMTPAPEISGSQLVCDDSEEIYETTENAGSTYVWEVDGGEVISGAGTHQIIVLWGDAGMGSVLVAEESAEGCIGVTEEYEITIDECIGISETSNEQIKIFPNPVSQTLYVDLSSISNTLVIQMKVFSAVGEIIETIEVDKGIIAINTSTYKNGVYFMQIMTNYEILTNKVFVVRN